MLKFEDDCKSHRVSAINRSVLVVSHKTTREIFGMDLADLKKSESEVEIKPAGRCGLFIPA
jgi:hypothetical protein